LLQASGLAEVITEQILKIFDHPWHAAPVIHIFLQHPASGSLFVPLKLFTVPDAQMRRTQYCTQNPGNLSDHSLHFQLADSVTLPP
jgi:hypothetical protein